MWTLSCEGSGGSALGDTLKKALLISWIGVTLYYFRIVRTCCSWINLSYFLDLGSGTSCLSTTNVELDREVPHGWVLSMVLGVGNILARSCQDHGKIILPMQYLLLCVFSIV